MIDFYDNNESVSIGSELCMSCGFCCQGILHLNAIIDKDEIDKLEKLGLEHLVQSSGDDCFPLPCKFFINNKCSIYSSRLSPCISYRCKLLEGLLNGDMNFADCKKIIKDVKNLIDSIQNQLPANFCLGNIRQEIEKSLSLSKKGLLSTKRFNFALIMDLAKIDIISKKYFFSEEELLRFSYERATDLLNEKGLHDNDRQPFREHDGIERQRMTKDRPR
jgi:hypothetical protein